MKEKHADREKSPGRPFGLVPGLNNPAETWRPATEIGATKELNVKIRILGAGCPRCEELKKRTLNVLAELNVAADVEKVTDIRDIAAFGVMATPALVIDGKVVSTGRIPRPEEIKAWVRGAQG